MLAPLLLTSLCLSAVLGLSSGETRWRAAWCVSLVGGCFLGVAILIRLPVLFLVPGFLGLIALGHTLHPTGSDLGWKRLILSGLILWGLPTAYFLTHPITIPYYSIPATFGAVTLLALGAFTIESRAADTAGVVVMASMPYDTGSL